VSDLIQEFPDSVEKYWNVSGFMPLDQTKPTKNQVRADRIIKELQQTRNTYDDVFVATIRKNLSIQANAFSRTINSDYFQKELEEHNIMLEPIPNTKGNQKCFRFY